MSVALIFITHEGIASSLLQIGEAIVQKKLQNLTYIEVPMDAGVDNKLATAEAELTQLELTEGIIFVTDIYGSTPSNIAQQLAEQHKAELITGVNLPMIIRLLNYRDRPKNELIEKAIDGARLGVQQHHG